ncbi:MAG TPA: hypothetical protein VFE56_02145 [Candidatus Binataceae bacterium]|nr:hypothetical protein [Candidatus Binataceae bacterium]
MKPQTVAVSLAVLMVVARPGRLSAADSTGPAEIRQIKQEIRRIKTEEERERARQEKLIEQLERKVDQLQSQNQQLLKSNDKLQATSQNLQSQTSQQIAQIKEEVGSGPSPSRFARSFEDYLGQHQVTIAGGVGASFIYDHQTATNTFALDLEPLLLYRVTDWLLFEGEIEANLPVGADAEFQLPLANAQIFLNDYMEILAGKFDSPFGDWYEDQSAFWVNRFITAPLPYSVEALVPPSDIGIQLRGGAQWGALGQDADYTVWVSNGPSYDPDLPVPVVGQALNDVNNITINTNGKAYGARFRVYPLPLDTNLGRLELGASTLNGKWLNGNWYNAWGVDFAYLRGSLQARGAFIETYRHMPNANQDNRQGWYVQFGYFLNQVQVPGVPEMVRTFVQKLEPLVRYSGVNQRAIVAEEISTVPEIAFSGSPALFNPHAREVALGLDYWLAPSIVWQNELDFELPRAGGLVTTFAGGTVPITTPKGATANDVVFQSQLSIGF